MNSTLHEVSSGTPTPYLTIRPSSRWSALKLWEVWQFRDLLVTLAMRDVKLRYRQTVIGIAWVILQPLITSLIFFLIFSRVGGFPMDGIKPFAFIFAGQLAWNVFNTTLTKASASLVGNSQLVSKVYFPRLVLPLSTVFSALIDFGVSLVMMVILMIVFHIVPGWSILLLPVFVLMLLLLALGVGLAAAAANVQYRDVGYVLPVITQFLFFASPVGYATSIVVHKLGHWSFLYFLNPLTPLLEAFRWSLFSRTPVHWPFLVYACLLSVFVFVAGAFQFKKMERMFADVI
jgi:lipopolysaccharide transport system permease protein